MSTAPESELDLDKLFLPAWAQEPASRNVYARYEGGDRPDRGDRRRDGPRRGPGDRQQRPGGPGGGRGPRRDTPGGASQARTDRPGGRPQGGDRGENRAGDRQRGGFRGDRRGGDWRNREERPEPKPLPELNLTLVAEDKGVDSLSRQIKMTGRAYPLFDIAQMILQRPERLNAVFAVKKNPEGKPIQPLFLCALDDTLWLSDEEAVGHVLQKHFNTFYQPEKTATEPPKGKYTFVAQCGMSGLILGPPNHHDYQNQLRKVHSERFSRLPFEAFKSRVKIVRDEEVVKKWVEDQSWKTEYTCLNLPEPVKLKSMEEVEKHFRETHKENIIKPVETHTMGGAAARSLRSPELVRLVRSVWDEQKRFPLQIATALSQQFASRGLQFFKVNKSITHVSVARPHYLDLEATPVSEGVKRIVDFINAHPKCTRRDLLEALAPAPKVLPVAPAQEQHPAQTPPSESAQPEGSHPAAPTEAAPSPSPTPVTMLPEQTIVISDLHWLVHQGHVIEFANGLLETAKKPAPKPPKPAKTPEQPPKATTAEAAVAESAGPGTNESSPTAGGTIQTEDADRHIDSQPGSVEEPTAGASGEIVRPGDNTPGLESSVSESGTNNAAEPAGSKVETPS